ncbi:hypothetical protein J2Y63_002424 [Shinella sp. BE166]|uniref:hypothetical protein n=1 Tax=Shinella sp. BE166 TaxID=3373918 RepID=UPI003EBAE7FC
MSITDTAKAQKLFEEAFPLWRYGSAKAAIREAYAFCKKRVVKEFTYRRARSLKEGAARRVDGEELDALRAALIEEHKREQVELRARLATLDEILAAADTVAARSSMESQGAEVRG